MQITKSEFYRTFLAPKPGNINIEDFIDFSGLNILKTNAFFFKKEVYECTIKLINRMVTETCAHIPINTLSF